MTEAIFDLIYVVQEGVSTMSCAIMVGEESRLVGPFPSKEAGPAIVAELLAEGAFGFCDKHAAEAAYMLAHFLNMGLRHNLAGQEYPYRVGGGGK